MVHNCHETEPLAYASRASPSLRRTPEIQRDFIEQALTGSVERAAQNVGRSASSAYRLRSRADAASFRAAWSAATTLAYGRVHESAMDRIVNGIETPVFDKNGERTGSKTVHSDRLRMFMLTHLRPDRRIDFTGKVAMTRLLPQGFESDPAEALARTLGALGAAD